MGLASAGDCDVITLWAQRIWQQQNILKSLKYLNNVNGCMIPSEQSVRLHDTQESQIIGLAQL